ncbi:anti-sigma factor family protein [Nocardia mexicana]|uniref:Putative zinc finger protein n=1 Tax=Nocardia mexicana TaxID=279262 RepID=A0A370GIL4_9NOCA|nr:zf-HC2 domain-containing protein [Nocardia mexicana]RDI43632.1 putative zinc finger protein [Nocardia mexicana]
MNCDELVELVTAFLDGSLDPATEQRFVAHLAECDGCETYIEQFRRTIALVGELPPPGNLPANVRSNLLTAFRNWPH